MNTKIIVSGIFKCGSSTIISTLKNNDVEKKYEIKKMHIDYNILSKTSSTIIIPIRNQKETYLSGFFQDVFIPAYDYSIFHDEHNLKLWNENHNALYFRTKYTKEIKGKTKLLLDKFKNSFICG